MVKSSAVISDYNATGTVNGIVHKTGHNNISSSDFNSDCGIEYSLVMFFGSIIICALCLTSTDDANNNIFKKGNIWLYVLMLIHLLIKVGISIWLTIKLYNIDDNIKHLVTYSTINSLTTFIYITLGFIGVMIWSAGAACFGIGFVFFCVITFIYDLPKNCRQYRQKLKIPSKGPIQTINNHPQSLKTKHNSVKHNDVKYGSIMNV